MISLYKFVPEDSSRLASLTFPLLYHSWLQEVLAHLGSPASS